MIGMATKRRATIRRMAHEPMLPAVAAIFFVITFAIKAFVDDRFMAGEVSAGVAYTKYATAAIACVAGLAHAFKNGEKLFVKQFNALLVIFFVFSLGSFFCMLASGVISKTVMMELMKFVIPIVLAYAVLNAVEQDTMYKCMAAVLLVSLLGYLVELARSGVNISAIFSADFTDSESATESSSFSGISLVLTFYFAYFNRRKLWLFLSAAFCVCTFKRLAILFAVVALVTSLFFPKAMSVRLPKKAITALKVATLLAVVLWAWLLLPEQDSFAAQLFGKDPRLFTMGRSATFRYLLTSCFQSYGFGSANEVVKAAFGFGFEMDLIKIAFELTPLAMILFVWLYWDVAGTTIWGVFIIGFFMLNMITSDSLTSNFVLTLAYMTCGLVEDAAPYSIDGPEGRRGHVALRLSFRKQ